MKLQLKLACRNLWLAALYLDPALGILTELDKNALHTSRGHVQLFLRQGTTEISHAVRTCPASTEKTALQAIPGSWPLVASTSKMFSHPFYDMQKKFKTNES
jgi:hypothetical protein